MSHIHKKLRNTANRNRERKNFLIESEFNECHIKSGDRKKAGYAMLPNFTSRSYSHVYEPFFWENYRFLSTLFHVFMFSSSKLV